MTANRGEIGHAPPPELFVSQVKGALENLYDFDYLRRHPLARESEGSARAVVDTNGQMLRRRITVAIEALSPGPQIRSGAPHSRPYHLLVAHYIEGATIQEAANELGISRRQAHRDLRRGVENVAAVLWAERPAFSVASGPGVSQVSAMQEEMGRLGMHLEPTELGALVARALDAVRPMAAMQGVLLEAEIPDAPVVVTTDPMMARQLLINLVSEAISEAQRGRLFLTLGSSGELVQLQLCYRADLSKPKSTDVRQVVAQLAGMLGWTATRSDRANGERAITLELGSRCPSVLMIDDNEGLVELLSDYLAGHACQVMAAHGGPEGLSMAQESVPDAIVLDVMLPGMDGWELLQRLRNHPRTATVPVIVCSVLGNPELAHALGASLFLPKPVSRSDVLEALRTLHVF